MNVVDIKALVRKRDGMKCTECGMTNDAHIAKYGKSLDVHRLSPGRKYTVQGCISLCQSCHHSKPKLPWASRVTLDDDLIAALEASANQNGRPIAWEARRLLRQALAAGQQPPPPTPPAE